jgi:hypothetical protein
MRVLCGRLSGLVNRRKMRVTDNAVKKVLPFWGMVLYNGTRKG